MNPEQVEADVRYRRPAYMRPEPTLAEVRNQNNESALFWSKLLWCVIALIIIVVSILFLRVIFWSSSVEKSSDSQGDSVYSQQKIDYSSSSKSNFEQRKAADSGYNREFQESQSQSSGKQAAGRKEKGEAKTVYLECENQEDFFGTSGFHKTSVPYEFLELPSVNGIQTNPVKYGVDLSQMNSVPFQEVKEKANPTDLIDKVSRIAEFSSNNPDEKLIEDLQRWKIANDGLKIPSVIDLELLLNDILKSSKNLFNKKKQIADLRKKVQDSLIFLKECEQNEEKASRGITNLKNIEDGISNQIREKEREYEGILIKIKAREDSLNDNERQYRDRISPVKTQLNFYEDLVRQKPKTEEQIKEKFSRINQLNEQISNRWKFDQDVKSSIKTKEQALQDYLNRKRELELQLERIDKEIALFNKNIKIILDNEKLKKLLNDLSPDDNKTGELSSKMSEKITEGKTVAKTLEELRADEEKEHVLNQIDYDKESFQKIMKNVVGVKRAIDQYEVKVTDIDLFRKKIDEKNLEKLRVQAELERINGEIALLRREIESLRAQLNDYGVNAHKWEDEIRELNEWIANKRRELSEAESNLAKYRAELDKLEKEEANFRRLNQEKFGDLDRISFEVQTKLNELRARLPELRSQIIELKSKSEKTVGDCSDHKIFYLKAFEVMPALEQSLSEDGRKLEELKRKAKMSLEKFYSL